MLVRVNVVVRWVIEKQYVFKGGRRHLDFHPVWLMEVGVANEI